MHLFQHKYTSPVQPQPLPEDDSTQPDIPLVHALQINDKDMIHHCLISLPLTHIKNSIMQLNPRKVNRLFQILLAKLEDERESNKIVLAWLKCLIKLKGRIIWKYNSSKVEQFQKKIEDIIQFQSKLRPLIQKIGVKKPKTKQLKPLLTYKIDQSTQEI